MLRINAVVSLNRVQAQIELYKKLESHPIKENKKESKNLQTFQESKLEELATSLVKDFKQNKQKRIFI